MLSINSDGKEIDFNGMPVDMLFLAKFLQSTQTTFIMPIATQPNDYYPIAVQNLMLIVHRNACYKLDIYLLKNNLYLTAGFDTLKNLGESLTNFFNGAVGHHDHFHLYYNRDDPNNLLANDNYSLIFSFI